MGTKLDLKATKLIFNLKNMETSELRELQDSIIEEIKSRSNMRTAAVIREFEVMDMCDTYLFITHVPESITAEELDKLLERAGLKFGFMNLKIYKIIIGLKNAHEDVKEAFLSGSIETLSYDELIKMIAVRETIN